MSYKKNRINAIQIHISDGQTIITIWNPAPDEADRMDMIADRLLEVLNENKGGENDTTSEDCEN